MRLSLNARPATKVFRTVVLPAMVAGAAAFADIAFQAVAPEETDPGDGASPRSSTTSPWAFR